LIRSILKAHYQALTTDQCRLKAPESCRLPVGYKYYSSIEHGTFHDIRKTAITNWFRQGLSEYDVITLAGHANFETTHRFYLAVADNLMERARKTTTH